MKHKKTVANRQPSRDRKIDIDFVDSEGLIVASAYI